MAAVEDRSRTGRPRIWTEERGEWIFHTVVDKNRRQLKFEFAYWSV